MRMAKAWGLLLGHTQNTLWHIYCDLLACVLLLYRESMMYNMHDMSGVAAQNISNTGTIAAVDITWSGAAFCRDFNRVV